MIFTSPRLRGEVDALFARRVRGVQVHQFTLAARLEPLTPTLSPQERGEGEATSHPHHPLSPVLAGQQPDQRLRRVLQPVDDVFLHL